MARQRADTVGAWAGASGLVLLLLGVGLLFLGVRRELPVAGTYGVVAIVAGLVGLRIRGWVHKERVLRRVGRDLHVPPGPPT